MCCVDCKDGGGSVTVIIQFCDICNATIGSSGRGNGVGVKYLSLHDGDRDWVYSYRSTPENSSANSGWLPWYDYSIPSRSSSVSQSNMSLVQFLNSKFPHIQFSWTPPSQCSAPSLGVFWSAIPKLQIPPYSVFLDPPLPPLVDCIYDLLRHMVLITPVQFTDAPSL